MDKKDLCIWMVKNGSKRPKKIKLKKLINTLNLELFTKKFFVNEKEAKQYIKNSSPNKLFKCFKLSKSNG